jgi:hypothetical protein
VTGRVEPVGEDQPIPFDPELAGRLVHFTDHRVRELAEARWRTDTDRDHRSWVADGPRDRGNPFVREARDWLRAAVSIGLLTPIDSDTGRPILAAGADVQCSFCGKGPDKFRTVVTGPGVRICNECVELCQVIHNEAADQTGREAGADL